MTTEPKLYSANGTVAPLTRLKGLAKKDAAAADELWAWHEEPELTNVKIRALIKQRFSIELARDGQLSEFWGWLEDRRRTDNYNRLIGQFEEFYAKANPGASREKVRDIGIALFLAETTAARDQKGFASIANLDLREREGATKAKFDERKIGVAERRVAVLEARMGEAQAEIAKLRDPKQELGEEDRKAIVAKVDEILGLK